MLEAPDPIQHGKAVQRRPVVVTRESAPQVLRNREHHGFPALLETEVDVVPPINLAVLRGQFIEDPLGQRRSGRPKRGRNDLDIASEQVLDKGDVHRIKFGHGAGIVVGGEPDS